MDKNIFTVLIMNESTIESFMQHQALFVDAINDGNVVICKWIESGRTVDQALPELMSLTNDTQIWRAIIVRYIDDDCMSKYEFDESNPFDFDVNHEDDGKIHENDVPLVRLAQMLGGVPPVEMSFKERVVHEENKRPKMVYDFSSDPEQEKIREELANKYKFDGKLPSSVIIVSVRHNYNEELEAFHKAWKEHREADSSKFWKVNQYPSICRFLLCDYTDQGAIQREADDFNMWFSIMLIAYNNLKTDMLSAYKLYTLKTIWDKDLMTDSFQSTVNRLRDAKKVITKEMKEDFVYSVSTEEELYNYRIEVPVKVDLPSSGERTIDSNNYHLAPSSIDRDVKSWDNHCELVEENYRKTVKAAERGLDKTAGKVREAATLDDEEVIEPLNKYQDEDLHKELNALFNMIVTIQGELPDGDTVNSDEFVKNKTGVRNYLLRRVTGEAGWGFYGAVLFLLLVSCALSLFFVPKTATPDYISLAFVTILFCFVIGLSALLALVIQKARLNGLIREYNNISNAAFNKVAETTYQYKDYVSNIASHSRCVSYFDISDSKRESITDIHEMRHNHIKAINIMLRKIKNWSKAYHLDVDFDSVRITQPVTIDTKIAPIENRLYAFESGVSYPIEVNHSGVMLESPYGFASRIEIYREELYGDE